MKRAIALILALILCLSFCACGKKGASSGSSVTKKPNSSGSSGSDGFSTSKISDSQKEKLAEDAVCRKLLEYLQKNYSYKYNASSTKYSIGSITGPNFAGKFKIDGKLYLYDKYGDLADIATFTCEVVVNDSGSTTAFEPRIRFT